MNYLAKFVSRNQQDWNRWIGLYLLAYRSARHETTKISPAEMCFGRELKLPIDLLRGNFPQKPESEENNYVFRLRRKLNEVHEEVRRQLDLSHKELKCCMIGKLDDYFSKQDRRFGYSILGELKERRLSYKVIGKVLMRLLEG